MMKPLALVGVLLIVSDWRAGPGTSSFTTQKKVVDVGPVTASVAEEHSMPSPSYGRGSSSPARSWWLMGQRRGAL